VQFSIANEGEEGHLATINQAVELGTVARLRHRPDRYHSELRATSTLSRRHVR
jgi:hypothetical protein